MDDPIDDALLRIEPYTEAEVVLLAWLRGVSLPSADGCGEEIMIFPH